MEPKSEKILRNRIVKHVTIKAKELIPHESNFRKHPTSQKKALQKLYNEVGFARSLLAYETEEGRLKLIDGHLRQSLDPEMEVTVEVLDVNEEEAKVLLASMDPLSALAETDNTILDGLMEQISSDAVELLHKELKAKELKLDEPEEFHAPKPSGRTKYLVTVELGSGHEQHNVWKELRKKGYKVTMKTM